MYALDVAIFITADFHFDTSKSALYVARDFISELFVSVRKPAAAAINGHDAGMLAEKQGGGNTEAARKQIPERYIDGRNAPRCQAFLCDISSGRKVPLVEKANVIGGLADHVAAQLLIHYAFQKGWGVVEGKHVAFADVIAGVDLDEDEFDKRKNVRGVCNRLGQGNPQPIGFHVVDFSI